MLSQLKCCVQKFSSCSSRLSVVSEWLTRITLGVIFVSAGWRKFQNLDGIAGYFDSLGIPLAGLQAPLVATVELVGGICILLGLATRISSSVLLIVMMVAVFTAHRAEIDSFTAIFGISAFLYAVLLMWLITSGAQHLSVDKCLKQKCDK